MSPVLYHRTCSVFVASSRCTQWYWPRYVCINLQGQGAGSHCRIIADIDDSGSGNRDTDGDLYLVPVPGRSLRN